MGKKPTAQDDTDRLLTRVEVERRIGIGRSTIYKLMREGRFPAPYQIAGAARWSLREVEDWLAKQPRRTGKARQDAA